MGVRRAAAVLAAAVAVVGTAVGVPLAVDGPHPVAAPRSAIPSASPTPTATGSSTPALAPGVIPWADLPPGSTPSPPSTTAAPPCTAADLRVIPPPPGRAEYATGGSVFLGGQIVARTRCLLPAAWSSLSAAFPDGHRFGAAPSTVDTSSSAQTVSAGERVDVTAFWAASYCGSEGRSLTLYLGLGEGRGVLTVPTRGQPQCRRDFPSSTSVSVEPPHVVLPEPPSPPWDDLTVAVDVPPAVAPGSTLRFTVTLTNPTATAVPLEPCPDYHLAAGPGPKAGWQVHQLNCQALPDHSVPASGSVTFAMEAPIAADAPTGPAGLAWFLAAAGQDMAGPGRKASFVIGDHPDQMPTPPPPYPFNDSTVPAAVAAAAPDGRTVTLASHNGFTQKLAYICANAIGADNQVFDAIGNADTIRFPGWLGQLGTSVLLPGTDTACDFLPSEETPSKPCASGPRDAPAACGGVRFFTVTGPASARWVLVETTAGWSAYPLVSPGVARVATDLAAPRAVFTDSAGKVVP